MQAAELQGGKIGYNFTADDVSGRGAEGQVRAAVERLLGQVGNGTVRAVRR